MLIFCRFIVTVVEKKSLAAFCSSGNSPDTHWNNVSVSAMLTLPVALNLMFGLAASNEHRSISIGTYVTGSTVPIE